MRAPTHVAFGLLTVTGAFSLASVSLHRDLSAVGLTILGSLLPDLDSPQSTLGRLLPFISTRIERKWGHRTVTHCLLALAALSVLALPLALYHLAGYAALLIGFTSHLLADCATKTGLALLHPNPALCEFPGSDRFRIQTGSLAELILLVVLILLLILAFPLSQMGGLWRALRYLAATPSMAYSDYREASTETSLRFKGRWRLSRQPVEGEALILDGSPARFVIAFNGEVLEYGEQGDILPVSSRVRASDHPLRTDTVTVRQEIIGHTLNRLPPGSFISGRLESSAAFGSDKSTVLPQTIHVCVRLSEHALELAHAPLSLLSRLLLRRQVDPERLAHLREQFHDARLAFDALSIRRPPVHYLKLREAQTELYSQERELATLQDSSLFFSGLLFVRIPGQEASQ